MTVVYRIEGMHLPIWVTRRAKWRKRVPHKRSDMRAGTTQYPDVALLSRATGHNIQPDGQITKTCQALSKKIFLFSSDPNQFRSSPIPSW
jgi:hypothetical protein